MSWDITTKEKALFEKALDGEDLSWEEPMLDESAGSLQTEMPDMAAEPPTLEGKDSPSVIDVSEAPIDEDEDPKDGVQHAEEPDLVTEDSSEIETSSIPEGRISGQRSRLVLLATEKWTRSPRSSTWQFCCLFCKELLD